MKHVVPLLLLFLAAGCSAISAAYPNAAPDNVLSPIPEIPFSDARGLGYFEVITDAERKCFRDVLGDENYDRMIAGQGLSISDEQEEKIQRCDTLITLARIDMGEIVELTPSLSSATANCLNGMLADAERVGKQRGWDKPRPDGGAIIDGNFWPLVSGKQPADCLTPQERAAYEAARR